MAHISIVSHFFDNFEIVNMDIPGIKVDVTLHQTLNCTFFEK